MIRNPKTAFVVFLIIIFSYDGYGQLVDSTTFSMNSRSSFYSYEKSAELLLQVPKKFINNIFNIRLICSNRLLTEWKGKVDKEILRLPVDLMLFQSTKRIEAEIQVSKTNSTGPGEKYISKCDLVILPYKPNEVKTDRLTGGLIVNRRQFFPFGFYCYSPVYPSLPEEEFVRGFNMISPYQKIMPETLNERKAYMDRCAELGMKVHYNLLSVSGGGGVGSKIDGLSDTSKKARLIEEIKTFRDHPALLGWYISDEPTGNNKSPEQLEEIYKIVKENDPWHPVSIVFMAPVMDSRKYSEALDIVMADPYPVPDLPVSLVGDITGQLCAEFNGKKPVWIVPQVFGGGELWGREPTIQEIRSMTWQSLIKGATGIQYFVRQGLNYFPKSTAAWSECGRMAMEVAELTPWLLSDEETLKVLSYSPDILVSSRVHDGQLLVMAVNRVNQPISAVIRIYGKAYGKARVLFENRLVGVTGGLITDQLAPFGSQVYLINLKAEKPETTASDKNLIKDPGFEDISSPGIPSACYARPGGDRGATYFLDTREHIEGNHSLRLVTPKDNCGVKLRFFPVSVTNGRTYLISVYAKIDPELGPADLTKKKNSQYFEISVGEFGIKRFNPGSDWQQFVTFVTIPYENVIPQKTNIALQMPSAGVAWFDLLQVTEGIDIKRCINPELRGEWDEFR